MLLVFVLGCAVSGAIVVGDAIQDTFHSASRSLSPMVTIAQNIESMAIYLNEGGSSDETNITYEVLSNISALPQVERYDFSVLTDFVGLEGSLVNYVPEHLRPDDMSDEELAEISLLPAGWNVIGLKGVQSTSPLDIMEGVIEITQGRLFAQSELDNLSPVAIVSEGFAQENSLGIGSTISLSKITWSIPGVHSELSFAANPDVTEDDIVHRRSYELEIVGLYRTLIEFNTGFEYWDGMAQIDAENFVYVPNSLIMDADNWFFSHMAELHPNDPWYADFIEGWHHFQNIFVLNDIGELDTFRQAVEEIAPPFVEVIDPVGNSQILRSSMGFLRSLALGSLIVSIGASIFILSILIVLFVRERKNEIGIYLALGEKRAKIVIQIFTEIMLVVLIGASLSLFAGSALAENVSHTLLQNNLTSSLELIGDDELTGGVHFEHSLRMMGVTPASIAEEAIASYDASLSTSVILTFYAVIIVTVLVSNVIPMLYILRLNPRKIMM